MATVNFLIKSKNDLPIHPVINIILDKRNGKLPPKLLNHDINIHLKLIGKEAKIVLFSLIKTGTINCW